MSLLLGHLVRNASLEMQAVRTCTRPRSARKCLEASLRKNLRVWRAVSGFESKDGHVG